MTLFADIDPRTGQWCLMAQGPGTEARPLHIRGRILFSKRYELKSRLRELGITLHADNTVTVEE